MEMEAGLLVRFPYRTWEHKTKENIYAIQPWESSFKVLIFEEIKTRKLIKTIHLNDFELEEIKNYESL